MSHLLAAGEEERERPRTQRRRVAGKVPEAKELDARPDKRIIAHSPYSEGARQMAWKHLRRLGRSEPDRLELIHHFAVGDIRGGAVPVPNVLERLDLPSRFR